MCGRMVRFHQVRTSLGCNHIMHVWSSWEALWNIHSFCLVCLGMWEQCHSNLATETPQFYLEQCCHTVNDSVYKDLSIQGMVRFLYPDFVFLHVHIISRYQKPGWGFEKPNLATWSALKENVIVWHVQYMPFSGFWQLPTTCSGTASVKWHTRKKTWWQEQGCLTSEATKKLSFVFQHWKQNVGV